MFSRDFWQSAKKTVPPAVIREIEQLSIMLSLQWPIAGDYQYLESLQELTRCPEVDKLGELLKQLPAHLWPTKDQRGNFIREEVLVWAHLLAFRTSAIRRVA